MRAVLTIALAAALLAPPAVAQEAERRPVGASAAYWTCSRQAASMADGRACLDRERDRALVALHQAEEAAGGTDSGSAVLWMRLTEYDCGRESAVYGEGNGSIDAAAICWIERTTERAAQVRRRGR